MMEVLLKRCIVREGERWTITEVDARDIPGSRGDCCLICESDLSVRRLWIYPADWHRMDDGRLLALFAAPLVKNSAARSSIRAATRDAYCAPSEARLER